MVLFFLVLILTRIHVLSVSHILLNTTCMGSGARCVGLFDSRSCRGQNWPSRNPMGHCTLTLFSSRSIIGKINSITHLRRPFRSFAQKMEPHLYFLAIILLCLRLIQKIILSNPRWHLFTRFYYLIQYKTDITEACLSVGPWKKHNNFFKTLAWSCDCTKVFSVIYPQRPRA